MVKILEVAEDVYRIIPGEVSQLCSEVYFVADERSALIETGHALIASSILEGLQQIGHTPTYIFLTHIHIDHAGGVGHLAQYLPGARVVVHQLGARHLIDPSRLIAGTRQGFGEHFEDIFGPILPVPGDRVRAVQDGETIALGERELTVIYTPGHAPHHICLYEGNKRWLFAGEALGVYFPESGVVMPSVVFPNFDLELTLKDIEELRKLSTEVIFYSHSGVRQATATLFQQIEDVTKEYGEMILRDMRRGEDLEGICRSMEAHLRGAQLDLSQLGPAAMFRMVKGYMDYFRKRGVA